MLGELRIGPSVSPVGGNCNEVKSDRMGKPLVVAPKPSEIKFCVDMRQANKEII